MTYQCPTCGDLLTTFCGGFDHCHSCGTLRLHDGSLPVVPMWVRVMRQARGQCLRSDNECGLYLATMDPSERKRLLAEAEGAQ